MTPWPHAPPHMLKTGGIYMITAGTHMKLHHFKDKETLDFLQDSLLELTNKLGWELHAWAILSNHYHFVGRSPETAMNLKSMLAQLHQLTSSRVNLRDGTPNRKVWHNFRDTKLTIHTSYMARLNYVHQNAVKHGLVSKASLYPWCSAGKFEMSSNRSFVNSVYSFDYSKVKVYDEF